MWIPPAGVVELADTQDLGSCAFGRESSSLSFRTTLWVPNRRGHRYVPRTPPSERAHEVIGNVVIPTRFNRATLLPLVEASLQVAHVVIVHTEPGHAPVPGTTAVHSTSRSIQEWWNAGLDVCDGPALVLNDDVVATAQDLLILFEALHRSDVVYLSGHRVGHATPFTGWCFGLWPDRIRPDGEFKWLYGDDDLFLRALERRLTITAVELPTIRHERGATSFENPIHAAMVPDDLALFKDRWKSSAGISRLRSRSNREDYLRAVARMPTVPAPRATPSTRRNTFRLTIVPSLPPGVTSRVSAVHRDTRTTVRIPQTVQHDASFVTISGRHLPHDGEWRLQLVLSSGALQAKMPVLAADPHAGWPVHRGHRTVMSPLLRAGDQIIIVRRRSLPVRVARKVAQRARKLGWPRRRRASS